MTAWTRKEVIGDCTLFLGDCLQVLPHVGPVEAIVSDPPYGIRYLRDSRRSGGIERFWKGANVKRAIAGKEATPIVGDDKPFDPSPVLAINSKRTILWGAHAYADKLPASYGWLVWEKESPDKWSGSDCELAWANFGGSVRRFRHRWYGVMRDGEECPFRGGSLVHPAQKPVALMRWCIEHTKAAEILDPYMGSGTTGVAAINLGRRFVGVEIEERYFNIACERISRASAQGRLFEERKPEEQVALI